MKRDDLRRRIRDARRGLAPQVRRAAAEAAAKHVLALPAYRDARRLAVYMAVDAELDPEPLLASARADGKEAYLPVISTAGDRFLHFQAYAAGTPLRPNLYRIPEPVNDPRSALRPAELDLVLAPLVAFDTRGHRLGMGGGYYDRSFAFLKDRHVRKPLLIGLAYECQKVATLPAESWDVPLAGVVTEQQFYPFAPT
ncbi:MAG TPA: 5-formyltetrahydrofolate cyclo-ligase [Gammaproteobacteria bacterium]|nr:5-formyltetrahydrofolate cyclo-ligase [Gammaproteobacteria bacterium]